MNTPNVSYTWTPEKTDVYIEEAKPLFRIRYDISVEDGRTWVLFQMVYNEDGSVQGESRLQQYYQLETAKYAALTNIYNDHDREVYEQQKREAEEWEREHG